MLPAHAGMVPRPPAWRRPARRAPRARGDGPVPHLLRPIITECSPRTRGWSPAVPDRVHRGGVLPAHAGMVPSRSQSRSWAHRAPRARGDGPVTMSRTALGISCSPRTRGWSRCGSHRAGRGSVLPAHAGMVPGRGRRRPGRPRAPRARGDGPPDERPWPRGLGVLPAHAGMVPPGTPSATGPPSAPRARGDGPRGAAAAEFPGLCSPRTRGWSQTPTGTRADLGRAPRARGDGPIVAGCEDILVACSPRTRGWSLRAAGRARLDGVLPAHAGMVPTRQPAASAPARAPRARGDGPGRPSLASSSSACSPRTRGWSHPGHRPADHRAVLPAHAGMVPRGSAPPPGTRCAPRARGDGPRRSRPTWHSSGCSPRTRGWSRTPEDIGQGRDVLPAHAGMVPCRPSTRPLDTSAPRARGDGPSPGAATTRLSGCSPRTRGWSRLRVRPGDQAHVLPAHAGMVPNGTAVCPDRRRAPRARGDGPAFRPCRTICALCSPRTRGWSPGHQTSAPRVAVLPAHAGMVPAPGTSRRSPRSAPRARGDGPLPHGGEDRSGKCSPRTRGWSPAPPAHGQLRRVLPAHAGMVPRPLPACCALRCAPRARGDGPAGRGPTSVPSSCSPRTRGWSRWILRPGPEP